MVSVRKHGEGDIGTMSIEDFAQIIKKEVNSTLQQFEV
jgi:threonyl-tRNA synthetase